jgi:hypothetical protein
MIAPGRCWRPSGCITGGCPPRQRPGARDGRRLGVVFRLPNGLWAWSAGYREPPEVARQQAAALYLDALDECNSDRERQACYDAASQALKANIRPAARPAITQVRIVSADPVRYQTGFGISVMAGPGFLVTVVSCGCRKRYYPRSALADHPRRRHGALYGRLSRPGACPAAVAGSARARASARAKVPSECSA